MINNERLRPRDKRSRIGLYVLVLLQVVFLSAIVLSYYAVDWVGKEIRLQTEPIDPRDIFYGDYVILNYEISRVPAMLWRGEGRPEYGDVVYVKLREDGGVYHASAIYPRKPQTSSEEVVLKGRINYSWDETIRIIYGLERYYVPEGTGKELEEKSRDMIVRVKVAPWGQFKISGLED
jgi:uncharacterized membrane-anchored protein